jgi:ElaB/YqjD/DUF883 family membrane-anchored ribosome-binding protein
MIAMMIEEHQLSKLNFGRENQRIKAILCQIPTGVTEGKAGTTFNILNFVKDVNFNFLIFPEISVPYGLVEGIVQFVDKNFQKNSVTILGLEWMKLAEFKTLEDQLYKLPRITINHKISFDDAETDKTINLSLTIIKDDEGEISCFFQSKIVPFDAEESERRTKSLYQGDYIYYFKSDYIKFMNIICKDMFGNIPGSGVKVIEKIGEHIDRGNSIDFLITILNTKDPLHKAYGEALRKLYKTRSRYNTCVIFCNASAYTDYTEEKQGNSSIFVHESCRIKFNEEFHSKELDMDSKGYTFDSEVPTIIDLELDKPIRGLEGIATDTSKPIKFCFYDAGGKELPPNEVLTTNICPMGRKQKKRPQSHDQPKDEQIGRDKEFDKICAIVNGNKPCLIHGMPGIGKSFMTSKIYENFSDRFNCVWMDYQGGGDIQYEKVLNSLLDTVNIKYREDLTTEEKESKLLDELKNNRIILFVDDIDDVEKISRFVRLSENAEIPLLVTSQTYGNDPTYFNKDDFIYLEELSVDDSIKLFESKANIDCNDHRGVIGAICDFLEYHPFAISVAAGLVSTKNFGVGGLCKALEKNIKVIDTHYDGRLKGPLRAFYLAYDRLDSDAKDLFSKIAVLSTRHVSFELLIKFTNTGNLEPMIHLTDRGLLERRGHGSRIDNYVMHQLVQKSFDTYVETDTEKRTREVMENIVEYLDENKYWDEGTHRTNIKNEIDNIVDAMKWFKDKGDYANLIKLESRMRHFFYVLGYWKQRRCWSEEVYKLRHKKDLLLADYGHEIVMAGLEGLGFLCVRDNKKYETTITIAEDANRIIERIGKNANGTYKSKDWKRAKCFYYRMKGISERNDYRAAAYLEKAYDLAGESDWESMKVAIGINLGVSYLNLKMVDDAIELFEESEKLALETTPPLHRRRVNALIGIGNAKIAKLVKECGNAGWNSKNVRDAVSHFKNAWEVDEEYVQDEPYLFVNITKGVSELLSHVEGVNIVIENLEKKVTDLENCKKEGDWNLRDFTENRKQTNDILNTIFKYPNV